MSKKIVPYEEARRCPRCGNPGEEGRVVPVQAPQVPRGTRVVYLWCRTVLCPWYNSNWPVQVYPDGTVQEHDHTADAKEYNPLVNFDSRAAALDAALAEQVQAEMRGDGEVRGR